MLSIQPKKKKKGPFLSKRFVSVIILTNNTTKSNPRHSIHVDSLPILDPLGLSQIQHSLYMVKGQCTLLILSQ